jgi:hypothetical protein
MAKKQGSSSAAPGPDFYLGTPWVGPDSLKAPDPNVPGMPALTERGEKLTGPDRAAGLGFSRYV